MARRRPFSPGFAISRSNSCRWNARRAAASSAIPAIARHGIKEEDPRRNTAQVGSSGRVDLLPRGGEVRQDVRGAIDKMTIGKSVQQVGAGMEFVPDENEEPRCEADGASVWITGIAKRGKELKVLVDCPDTISAMIRI